MADRIEQKLKEIEASEARLASERKALEAELEKEKKRAAKLEKLVAGSGYDTPRDLVLALIDAYNIRLVGRKAGKKTASGAPRRKRTTVTAELRDDMKRRIEEVGSVNAVAQQVGISYAVVSKIWNGAYDHL